MFLMFGFNRNWLELLETVNYFLDFKKHSFFELNSFLNNACLFSLDTDG